MRKITVITLLMILLCLTGCSKLGQWGRWGRAGTDEMYKGMTAKQLYDSAQQALAKEDYSAAAKRFEALEAMYPFSPYSEKAEMHLIYTYFKNGDNPSAASTADRYIHLYPTSDKVDYAYYMKGLANFNQTRGSLARYIPMDVAARDPGTQQQAYDDFTTLVHQFPHSRYTPDAQQRMIYLRNNFAQKELEIAEFYLKRKMYVAAANRASYIVTNYSQAPQSEDALAILVIANRRMGINQAANEALQVLKATYPHSKALRRVS